MQQVIRAGDQWSELAVRIGFAQSIVVIYCVLFASVIGTRILMSFRVKMQSI